MTTEIVGTPAVDRAALEFVLDHERRAGREPIDARSTASTPADVVSGDRLIEVKAYSGTSRGNDLWLETPQAQAAVSRGNVHLYLVESVGQGDPALFRLLDIHGELLRRLMTRAVERSYVTVPWPEVEYDALSSTERAGVNEERASDPR
ncbi:MAG TPA: hypothetical protein VFW79_07865 [Cellulomonas sp.]|uniref:hypothetical protein n=1 Tax=Cellulomonas sp. TaxID=40001 RepID=UPI002E3439A0|nr:hypothetical protein [Cellulomonas sp.]HEX5332542.1 hypothetical protein [Cellulomonas sp.]